VKALGPRHLLIAGSLLFLALRLLATRVVGFGDSEALYACYAMHPAPAYLDHPGLVGLFARLLGSGGVPTPTSAHYVTSLMATLVPWIAVAAARAAGATHDRAHMTGVVMLVIPQMAVGLFGMTPDLLLAVTWLFVLGISARALGEKPASNMAAACFVAAGLLAGVAATSKVSGLLLFGVLAWTYASREARAHARTVWPWAGLLIGLTAFVPVLLFEARTGWPMVRHRLIDTQAGAGPSLRNIGAVLGGQLLYVSPVLAVCAVLVLRELWRRERDAVDGLLFRATVLPLAILLPLSLWSRVAEPHWLAPVYLALVLHFAKNEIPFSPRLSRWAVGVAAAMSFFVHAWVLMPEMARLMPAGSDPKYDLANELYGWQNALEDVKETLRDEAGSESVVVVGPHWVVCAQLHAALGPNVRVGCLTPIRDDFDVWEPRARWQEADKIIYVTDNRFPEDPAKALPGMSVARRSRVTFFRGGRLARVFLVTLLESRARS